ncbi:Putative CDP-diacylglycerol--glycerol-3-phosphate 3-phosphatidyl-transferase 2 [Anaerohalosphaera lusitana]|uniref:CDP-diacylglycerol--glycerol-3-phosphate 3-phosphatidyltransferase n=1 Tax=Anaerohalosphaera lusitana TaxID=1936003 RepID=A0A1U9NRH2_9BACT|nr:CDP-alcohol phosphatidyltransferase family protein [Anaerohalosphaera lusitana]AQT70126.1 Putative CDP-diacylglycerol--glycerol-3-phosphate 3-phosphatidyl-transferase 2 [Anaerohalosphaera lusitana]
MQLTIANKITIVRILLIAPYVISLLKMNQYENGQLLRYTAFAIFLLMCISDVVDGYMARVKKQVTRLGSFLDPMADKLLMMSSSILLATPATAVEGFVLPTEVAVLIIGKDLLLLLGFLVLYMMIGRVHVVPGVVGKFAAFLQLVMVASILIGPEMSKAIGVWPIIVSSMWWTAAALAILATMIYLNYGKKVIESEAYSDDEAASDRTDENGKQ